jgi:hypothetical protein
MDTAGMTFLPYWGQKPSFRPARCRRRRLGCEIGAISILMRLEQL